MGSEDDRIECTLSVPSLIARYVSSNWNASAAAGVSPSPVVAEEPQEAKVRKKKGKEDEEDLDALLAEFGVDTEASAAAGEQPKP